MSLTFKYWIEFDQDGEIKSLYKSKYECENKCKEYIVKLIPIKRDKTDELLEAVDSKTDELIQNATQLNSKMKRFRTELDKTVRSLKRIKI